ncbi:hypothetical protein [Ferruginibacter sp. SUN106]|uniref:hypothetical protein n=1 Tax=Ferruginibacter sp. SUN106 TaxID=2978348 RepID=UPI003D35AFAD
MKKPFLLFALKCSVIVYFAACTSIDQLAVSNSITDKLTTKGAWKVNCFGNATNDNTCVFEGYAFAFDASGKVVASKDGNTIEGHWLEDNISKTITISFKDSNNPFGQRLNTQWSINTVDKSSISLKSDNRETLLISII